MFKKIRHLFAVLGLSLVIACAQTPSKPVTLFERLGGNTGVSTVVGLSLTRAAQARNTQRSFDGIKIEAIQKSLTQQICSLAGGGCVYEGETMARSHQDLKITASEFDALVEMLRQELDRAGIAAGAKNELLRLLAPMKRDIVAAR
jgi:hemoglobin